MSTSPKNSKTALITGASSGIGKALAENFAKDGYALVLAARGVARMQALADELQQRHGITATVIGADLETSEGATRLHAEVKRRGIILSALVNNAGYGSFGEFKDSALGPELAMMQLNMTTVVVLTKLFLPDLIATRGKVLNTASTGRVPARPLHGGLLRDQGLRAELLGSDRQRARGNWCQRDGPVPRPHRIGVPGQGRHARIGVGQGQKLPTAHAVAAQGYRAMQRGQRVFIPA